MLASSLTSGILEHLKHKLLLKKQAPCFAYSQQAPIAPSAKNGSSRVNPWHAVFAEHSASHPTSVNEPTFE
jgi:hypothetical protein